MEDERRFINEAGTMTEEQYRAWLELSPSVSRIPKAIVMSAPLAASLRWFADLWTDPAGWPAEPK